MTDRIAINGRKAAYLMLESGLSFETVQAAIYAIPQPSAGYYYATDVMNFIRKESA